MQTHSTDMYYVLKDRFGMLKGEYVRGERLLDNPLEQLVRNAPLALLIVQESEVLK